MNSFDFVVHDSNAKVTWRSNGSYFLLLTPIAFVTFFSVNLRLQFPFNNNNNNNSRRRFNRATNWFESFPLSAPYGPSIG